MDSDRSQLCDKVRQKVIQNVLLPLVMMWFL